ncbi:MAG: putative YphP/YqiW family bacilliredoxin [Planctomycetota bacterium]
MYKTLIQKIEEHETYGPALRSASEKKTPMVLHIHAHQPDAPWCVAVLAERPMLLDLVGGGGSSGEELVHIAGFAPNQSEGKTRAGEFAAALKDHYSLDDLPRIDVEDPPAGEAPAAAPAAAAAPPAGAAPPSYDPAMVQPMREEVTRLGVSELFTVADVDEIFSRKGSTLIFVNSVCGCAAGGARPGLALAMQMGSDKKPDNFTTVFAGMEKEAVAHARERFKPYQASSPQFALIKDGELVQMWQRHDIEGRDAQMIAQSLVDGFGEHC